MSDPFWFCIHLDERGRPCNRRTMKPLSMCSLHREAPAPQPKRRASRAEYQRARRASLRNAGVAAVMEGA